MFDAVNKRQFDKARQIVRDEPMKGDPDWDAKFYILKVGLINSVVNPAEVRFRMDEIKKMESVAEKDGGFAKLLKWINDYVYIKENYPSIEQSVAAIKNAGKGYKLEEKEMLEYSKKMLDRIYFVLGRRVGAYKPIVDDKELNKALSEFSKLMLAQYYDKAKVGMITERIKDEISEIYTEKFVAMTVCDSNAKLLARLMQARDKALEDSEFCDFEVSRAEAAIAEQVGGTEKYGHKYQCNAVLGDYARAMRLRKKGRILNAELYQSLLLGAIYLDSCDVFDYALAKGAVLDASSRRDPLKRPAILLALQLGRNSFVEKIRQKGASLSVCDVNGNGVIHYAVERGDLTMLRMMMKGNDINLKNKAGETPLFIAVRKNQPALVKLLTGVDAKSERPRSSVGIKNAAEKNVFDVACEYGSRDVLDILEKAGAEYGPAQLIIAVSNSRLAVVKWLVAMGVDVNAPGVMAAVVNTEVENYLVSEGGIPVSKPAFVPSVKASGTNREASVIGNIEFKLKEVK